MLRIAIIGLGHIGRTHVAALLRTDGLRLVAGCDQDVALASVLPEGVSFYASGDELLAVGGFDTVVVATPNRSHNSIARNVLEAGYHVIVEKPAAKSVEALEALEALAAARKCHVYYAFHAAAALEVDALLVHLTDHRNKYGPLTSFYSRFYDPYIDSRDHLLPHARSLDDCWSDSGVNALSVLDRIQPVDCLTPVFRRESGRNDIPLEVGSASVGFHFPVDGTDSAGFGLIDTAWDQGRNYKATILCFGHSGWRLVVDHSAQTVTASNPQAQPIELARFDGDRLLNHYLGLFVDYRSRVHPEGGMNGAASRRVHQKLFEGMTIQ